MTKFIEKVRAHGVRNMKFTDIFIRRPVLALVVSLLILLIGLKCMLGLQIRQYPRLYNTTITVSTIYPGASPDLIQGFITTPIEQAVATAEGIDYLTSNSIQGTSTVTAYIRLNYDPSQALTDIMAKVQQVKYLMPTQAQDPVILKATGQTTAVMYIGFASAELTSAAISDYLSRVVQPLLSTVDGIASADILGGQTFAMRLWLDPSQMAARGVSANDVSLAIRVNNYQSAPGQAKGFFTITNISARTGLAAHQRRIRLRRAARVAGGVTVLLLIPWVIWQGGVAHRFATQHGVAYGQVRVVGSTIREAAAGRACTVLSVREYPEIALSSGCAGGLIRPIGPTAQELNDLSGGGQTVFVVFVTAPQPDAPLGSYLPVGSSPAGKPKWFIYRFSP
jgi:hypothetical protein